MGLNKEYCEIKLKIFFITFIKNAKKNKLKHIFLIVFTNILKYIKYMLFCYAKNFFFFFLII